MSLPSLSAPKPSKVFSVLVLVQILFGINYVTSKTIVAVFPPIIWASARNLIAGLSLLAYVLWTGRKRPIFNKDYFISLSIYSFLGIVVSQAAFLTGLVYTTAINSSIINTLIPVLTLLLVAIKGHEVLSLRKLAGFIVAFCGVLVIRKIESFTFTDKSLIGDALVFVNCIAAAFFLTYSKPFVKSQDPIWALTGMFLIGSVGLAALGTSQWIDLHWPVIDTTLVISILFSIFGSTLLAYMLNFWALKHTHSSSVALFCYLQPLVAGTFASIFLGEVITFRTVASCGLILLGMMGAMSGRVRAIAPVPLLQK